MSKFLFTIHFSPRFVSIWNPSIFIVTTFPGRIDPGNIEDYKIQYFMSDWATERDHQRMCLHWVTCSMYVFSCVRFDRSAHEKAITSNFSLLSSHNRNKRSGINVISWIYCYHCTINANPSHFVFLNLRLLLFVWINSKVRMISVLAGA